MAASGSEALRGVACAVGAYLIWGLTPVYWKALQAVPAIEILGHRAVWSAVFLILLLWLFRQLATARAAFADVRTMLPLVVTTTLISVNWFIFIWGVNAGHLLQVSLGYYINPLVNVLLGIVFLREKLRPWQAFAVLLATAGVLTFAIDLGVFPWISLALAFTFGFYGLVRKVMPVEPLVGLAVETVLMAPIALVFLAYLAVENAAAAPGLDPAGWVLLILVGVVTALPLLLFTAGAKRLRYATIGLLQYIGPTGHFVLAVFVYDEPFTQTHLITFSCIWSALILYSWDATRSHRQSLAAQPPE